MPAVNYFEGGDSFTASNWSLNRYPTYYDDVIFDGAYTSDPCTLVAIGPYTSVQLVNGYTGTVTHTTSMWLNTLVMEGGTLNPSASDKDVTVSQAFTWTGGVLNSSNNPSNLFVRGVGVIAPAAAGVVTTNDTLHFIGAPNAPASTTMFPGTLAFGAVGGGMIIGGFATLTAKTFTAGQVLGVNKDLNGAQKIQILAGGTLGIIGPGTINYDLWMSNAGTLDLSRSATVNLKGVVNPAPQNPTNYGQLAGGQLNIENGSVLTAVNTFAINGGTITLKTNANLPANQQAATMSGLLLFAGGTINFAPPITIGTAVTYGTFVVNGDVYWSNATYAPNVDYTTAGLANKWVVNGKMNVDPNQVNNLSTCLIQPVSQNGNNPPALSDWVVLDATTTNNTAPTVKKDAAGNQLTFSSVAVGNRIHWKLSS